MNSYTSNLLSHFVGRSKKTDDERFELLLTIIRGEKLIANLSAPDNPESNFQVGSKCDHVGEVFGKCDCVCFCDIPDEALSIHTSKYSRFGIGFKKTFIAQQGARPVMYVPKNFPIVERGDCGENARSATPRDPSQYFPHILLLACHLLPLMELSVNPDALNQLNIDNWLSLFNSDVLDSFLNRNYHPMIFSLIQGTANQMAYVKLYDATLQDDHPDNYYMEREWRSLANISFSVHDIECIYLPNSDYKTRFEQEFQNYEGKFYLFEQEI